jgi:hypothetical protein
MSIARNLSAVRNSTLLRTFIDEMLITVSMALMKRDRKR